MNITLTDITQHELALIAGAFRKQPPTLVSERINGWTIDQWIEARDREIATSRALKEQLEAACARGLALEAEIKTLRSSVEDAFRMRNEALASQDDISKKLAQAEMDRDAANQDRDTALVRLNAMHACTNDRPAEYQWQKFPIVLPMRGANVVFRGPGILGDKHIPEWAGSDAELQRMIGAGYTSWRMA